MLRNFAVGTVLLALGTGCVTKAEFERQMALGADRERTLHQKSAAELAAAEAKLSALRSNVEALKQEVDSRDRQVGDAHVQLADFQKKLDDTTALSDQLRQELQKAGKNVDGLMAEKGKMRNALEDSCRLVLNTAAGLGGLLDVGSELGLYKNYEDFGQTLGHWGVGDGGYLVLPFLGASTVRDTVGFIPDTLLNPISWITDSKTRSALFAVDTVDTRLSYLAAETMISGDKYDFVRNAYQQRREYLVNDGEVYDELDEY